MLHCRVDRNAAYCYHTLATASSTLIKRESTEKRQKFDAFPKSRQRPVQTGQRTQPSPHIRNPLQKRGQPHRPGWPRIKTKKRTGAHELARCVCSKRYRSKQDMKEGGVGETPKKMPKRARARSQSHGPPENVRCLPGRPPLARGLRASTACAHLPHLTVVSPPPLSFFNFHSRPPPRTMPLPSRPSRIKRQASS